MPISATRSEKIDLRITPEAKRKIYIAAAAIQCSVSEFVLESALARAEETLADRCHFGLNRENWELFMAALDAQPRCHPRMERLLQESSVFEETQTNKSA